MKVANLRAQVDAVLRREPGATVVAVRADPEAAYPDSIDLAAGSARVAPCRSPLAVADALAAHDDDDGDGGVLVLVCDLEQADVSADVAARIARGRLVQVDPLRMVPDLFSAEGIDPRMRDHGWAASLLVDNAPAQGYPPAKSGFVTLEEARATVLTRCLGLEAADVDLAALVAWAADPAGRSRYERLEPDTRAGVAGWLVELAGPAAALVLAAVDTGHGADAVALGLVCDVVCGAGAGDAGLVEARVRLERFTATPIDVADGAAWAGAAAAVEGAAAAGARAEEILADVGASAEAWRSDHLAAGFTQRLTAMADALVDAVADPTSAAAVKRLEGAVASVVASTVGPHREERAAAAQMAARLVRRLAEPELSATAGFDAAVGRYVRDGGYADWAREHLASGDGIEAVDAAYRALLDATAVVRERENGDFARHLATWTGVGSDGVPVLEIARVLDAVVAPIAAEHPVLVVVADGMGYATYRELQAGVARAGWRALHAAGSGLHTTAVAVAPSITEVSRASLFAGDVTRAAAAGEKKAFEHHTSLVAAGQAGSPPVLWHKADLAHGGLDPGVRAAIDDTDRRVVGAVVNAVDDQLDRGDQLVTHWDLWTVPAVRHLLEAAYNTGRVVVLTADHGHVIEHGQTGHRPSAPGSGNRWRVDDGSDAGDGEVRLDGRLVVGAGAAAGGGSIVAAVAETLRYGPKKAGYHGGASPQEMLVPVAVLAPPGTAVEGWDDLAPEEPPWWTVGGGPAAAAPPAKQLVLGQTAPVEEEEAAEAAVSRPKWVAALFASDTWAHQRGIARRGAPGDDVVATLLVVLDTAGGTLVLDALARGVQVAPARVGGFVRLAQSLLNVEGYAVLSVDGDTVRLDKRLLAKQFDIEKKM